MLDNGLSGVRPAHWSVDHTFRLAEAVHNDPGARVKRQHVVSKTVLRNYTDDRADAPWIMMVDLRAGTQRPVGVSDAAIEKDLIRVDSLKSEQIWGLTETLVPDALTAARDASILTQPDQLQVLRRVVALHFARSISTLQVVNETWPRIRQQVIADLVNRGASRIADEFNRRFGRNPTPDEVIDLAEHSAKSGIDELVRSGAYARIRVEQFYDQALERFESWGVEVIRAPSNDLVITDNPVVLSRRGDNLRVASMRMAIDDAESIVFPIAPDTLISMGRRSGYGIATQQAVTDLNRSQVAGAHRFVFHRLGQDISDIVPA